MKRRAFNLPLALSLLLVIASIALWTQSYFAADYLFLRRAAICSSRGYVSIDVLDHPEPFTFYTRPPTYPRDDFLESAILGGHQWHYIAGFGLAEYSLPKYGDHALLFLIPQWSLCVAFALVPALWLVKTDRRRHRIKASRCPTCGYDLRATPTRCPECGSQPAKSAAPI